MNCYGMCSGNSANSAGSGRFELVQINNVIRWLYTATPSNHV
jgi:hypothetical protein